MKKTAYEVYEDNGGGLHLQAAGYCHSYDGSYDYLTQLAEDIRELENGDDPADWDGNEIETCGRIEETPNNGCNLVLTGPGLCLTDRSRGCAATRILQMLNLIADED